MVDLCEAECSACLLYQYTSLLSRDVTNSPAPTEHGHHYLPFADERRTFPGEQSESSPKRWRGSLSGQFVPPSVRSVSVKSPCLRSAAENSARRLVESFWESFEEASFYGQDNRRSQRPCRRQEVVTANNRRQRRQSEAPPEPSPQPNPFHLAEASARLADRANLPRSTAAPPAGGQSRATGKSALHWLTEFAFGRLSKRKPKRRHLSVKAAKARKKRGVLKRKGVRLFGPEQEVTFSRQDEETTASATLLLRQLDYELACLKRDGVTLSKQMWLLFSSFEEFLRSRYPKTAAGIKRYAKFGSETTASRDQCDARRSEQDGKQNGIGGDGANANYDWIEESSHLYSNVAEVADWLRPADECDDWSDDSDRVRKLTKTDEGGAEQRQIVTDENFNNVGRDGADNMNILWYTKLKKIDKSSSRRYRNRTPERKHWQSPDVFGESNNSALDIETPVRRPEELFDQSTPLFGVPTGTECQSGRDFPTKPETEKNQPENNVCRLAMSVHNGKVSPITISSGYDSDRDALREVDVDGIFYGPLPGYKKGTPIRKENRSPLYVAMTETSGEKLYENVKNCARASDVSGHLTRSDQDLTTDQRNDDLTILAENPNMVGLSRSLDDLLADGKTVRRLRHLASKCSTKHVHKFTDCPDDVDDDDDDDKENTCVYENLPAALYAQVSPPKPQIVYRTPTCLKADPMWESTPLDESHKPRIVGASGASDTGSQHEESLQSQIRKRIRLLLEDRSGSQTPYKSAFRPYNKDPDHVAGTDGHRIHVDQSIAELRRAKIQLEGSHYLYMSPARGAPYPNWPSLRSVAAGDVSFRSATDVDRSRFEGDTTTGVDKSPDSGHGSTGTSELGSPHVPNNVFGNLKDSRLVHKDKLCKVAEPLDSDSEFNNTYETIPADIETFWIERYPEAGRRSATTSDGSASEHTYCKIGDVPTMLEPDGCFKVPEPPPCVGRASLRKKNDGEGGDVLKSNRNVNDQSLPGQPTTATDGVVEGSRCRSYTASEVLRSFRKYAGHLDPLRSEQAENHVLPAPEAFDGRQPARRSPRSAESVDQRHAKRPTRTASSATADRPAAAGSHVSRFTPGFSSSRQASQLPVAQYSAGGGVRLAAIRKTLSFRDFASPSCVDSASHFRQRSEPVRDVTKFRAPSPRHPESFGAGTTVDYTPTVIDGLQSYQTTPSDVTAADLILTPPSAFRSASPPEEPLYENIRDMGFMREKRRRALEEGHAHRSTPLQRTQSALLIHKLDFDDAREIFC